jgi:hypothetical protein
MVCEQHEADRRKDTEAARETVVAPSMVEMAA